MKTRKRKQHLFTSTDIRRIIRDVGADQQVFAYEMMAIAIVAVGYAQNFRYLYRAFLAVKSLVVILAGFMLFGRFNKVLGSVIRILTVIQQAMEASRLGIPRWLLMEVEDTTVLSESLAILKELLGAIGGIVGAIKVLLRHDLEFLALLMNEIELEELRK